jgi:hypothetical protein
MEEAMQNKKWMEHADQVPRQPHPDGRVQAPHHDPSAGDKDRRRGMREKGGERSGEHRASREKNRSGRRGGPRY